MRVVVCVRQGLDGELCPFDASAYEAALRIENSEVILLSMGAIGAKDFIHSLTRLGAKKAILLSDKAFAGADTLATAYTLSLAIKRICPDLVLCGRQSSVGDTAQTGAMLAELCGYSVITNAMSIELCKGEVVCETRSEGRAEARLPALLSVERINALRLPRLRSKLGEIEVWSAELIGADIKKCGLLGSPTRVVRTYESEEGRRRCKFIPMSALSDAIEEGLRKKSEALKVQEPEKKERLPRVCIVGEAPRAFAEKVGKEIVLLPMSDADVICEAIKKADPDAVIWGSDTRSKRLSATVAARLSLGLCADCTLLDCEGDELMMYRPALSGSVIAKIRSLVRPAMASVRTERGSNSDIVVTAGYGARGSMEKVRELAQCLGAELCATRKMVDNGYLPYSSQVGLTGKTVSPSVYIAVGVSGAIHHIAGMQRSGTVIAISPDKDAPVFDYADYGILEKF